MEAAITAGLAHPHIVRCHAHATLPGHLSEPYAGHPHSSEVPLPAQEDARSEEVWLLLEYCDRGTLLVRCGPSKDLTNKMVSGNYNYQPLPCSTGKEMK